MGPKLDATLRPYAALRSPPRQTVRDRLLRAVGGRSELPWALFCYASLILLSAVFLFPIFWIVGLSFKTRDQMFADPPLFLWQPTFENYARALRLEDGLLDSPFFVTFTNSLTIALGAVILSVVLGTLASYSFARFRFKGAGSLLFALLLMRMLPPIAVVVPMYSLFQRYGLVDTYTGIILAYTTFTLPIVIWILRDFFGQFPRELEESAWIDGASRWATLWYVVLPSSKSALVAATIMAILFAWNDFLFAAVLTGSNTRTLPVLMAGFAGDTGINWGEMTASAVLVILPAMAFSFLAQRHLASGVLAGSVKE